eukprot:scaffold69630_cov43-Tisochrysis_lutea.AAC.1
MNNIWIYLYQHQLSRRDYRYHRSSKTGRREPLSQPLAKWKNGLKGPKHLEFPLADEYTLSEKTHLGPDHRVRHNARAHRKRPLHEASAST